MSFTAGSFSYLNDTIYGVTINANMDLRIENFAEMPGAAKVYFTDASLPIAASNPVPPPPGFTIMDSLGNNVGTMRINGIQQCAILDSGMTHFTIP
ncbi:hypothetical protein C1645_838417 [Glomus cerebriforme]|uniref:Uncharacterized protein n=1 Tax=Glomus cerebriforme TaxID=658196 RepID=A0A397S7A9_9GLOM|nr:hypothetical protein C1645_838417 [Glomus cerebriforme]